VIITLLFICGCAVGVFMLSLLPPFRESHKFTSNNFCFSRFRLFMIFSLPPTLLLLLLLFVLLLCHSWLYIALSLNTPEEKLEGRRKEERNGGIIAGTAKRPKNKCCGINEM